MSTTKKVASTKIAKKQPASAVSSQTKKTIKPKTAAAAPQKTKKQPNKSTIKIADNTKKKTSSTSKTAASIEHKLKRVEELHTKKAPPKLKKSDVQTDSSQKTSGLKFPPVVLSPYRFPLDAKKIAVGTARYGGIFFIVIGAIFTLLLSNNSFNTYTQTALVSNALDTSPSTTIASLQKNSQPEVFFSTKSADASNSNLLLNITVPEAQTVAVSAYYKTQGYEVPIGNATKISANVWEIQWNTTKLDEGEYRLKALVKNSYGTYEAVDSKYATIERTTFKLSTTTDESAVIVISESVSEYVMDVQTVNAQKVKIYAQETHADAPNLLGYAYEVEDNAWRYHWPLEEVPAGEYTVTAYAVKNDREVKSNEVIVTVEDTAEALPDETDVNQPDPKPDPESISPDIKILYPQSPTVKGRIPITIVVKDAQTVELYVLPANSLVKRYVGTAKRIDKTVWSYSFDTALVPNGDYTLVANVQNAFGTYSDTSSLLSILNSTQKPYTPAQQEKINVLEEIASEEKTNESIPDSTVSTETESDQEDTTEDALSETLASYNEELDIHLQRLAAAMRMNDAQAAQAAQDELKALKQKIREEHGQVFEPEALAMALNNRVDHSIVRVKENVEKIEKILKERTKQSAATDSDSDGISDYDEVTVYSTDPFAADSDGDGFLDGTEILNGFDPTDPRSEVAVMYESPKEAGVVRNDMLQVSTVATAQKNTDDDVPAAIISGTALPNSFVTLYIFSTPVVITVKTDTAGNWNYRFEKELEDGEHEVYVGVTDNSGRIVAKSEPFRFIKEAEAFSPVENAYAQQPAPAQTSSFVSQYMIYLVLSISVVAIGLVLILLGLHLDSRQRRFGDNDSANGV